MYFSEFNSNIQYGTIDKNVSYNSNKTTSNNDYSFLTIF